MNDDGDTRATTQMRVHPRYAVEIDTEIVTAAGARTQARTKNISRGGFCLMTPSPVPIGEHCTVRIALVFPDEQLSEALTMPAVVVWSTAVGDLHQIGLKFNELSPEARHYLDLFIKLLEEGEEEDTDPGKEE